ncbi:MAG: lipoprotein [Gammaproteobacteria bacterium]|nr:lipoprotein [Gammaproteobacteria bacterium]MDE2346846.1 lipoprotein [Gammaproteobacteria bacterium]
MRTPMLVCCAAGFAAFLLSGCGQTGPLYLPVTPPSTIPAMPPASSAKPASTATAPAVAHTHNPPATATS